MELMKKFLDHTTSEFNLDTKPTAEEKTPVDFMTSDLHLAETIDDMFPCMLAVLGSGFAYMQVRITKLQ